MSPKAIPEKVEESPEDLGPGAVLIVDDDPALRGALCSVLEMKDYRVLEADSRKSALAMMDEHEDVSVVICSLIEILSAPLVASTVKTNSCSKDTAILLNKTIRT